MDSELEARRPWVELGLRFFVVVCWFDLALGLVLLGYAALEEPGDFKIWRGGVLCAGMGLFCLWRLHGWRRRLGAQGS